MIRMTLTALSVATLCASPAFAQFPGQAPAPAAGIQINRPTDADLT